MSIEALTEILQQHIGCYSDDRARERCVVHGTDWPCEALSDLVSEVQSWAETYSDVPVCEACRAGEHGLIDEVTKVCVCCGERQQPTRQWCCGERMQPLDLCSVCWTDHSDGIPFPEPTKENA